MEDEKEETSEAMSYGEDEDVDEEINLDELMADLEEDSYEEGADEEINEDASDEDIAKLEKALGENTDGVNESVVAALVGVPALIAAAGGIQALQDKSK